jgi:hypothetical protein
MKLRNPRQEMHRLENFLGDGLGLDRSDEAELAVTVRADDIKTEYFSQQPCPRDVPGEEKVLC